MKPFVTHKGQLRDFVKSVTNLNPDWHEGSDWVEAQIKGTILDNEGMDNEIVVRITDKKDRGFIEVNLATLLSFATQEVVQS